MSVMLVILGQERRRDIAQALVGDIMGRTASGRRLGYRSETARVYRLGPLSETVWVYRSEPQPRTVSVENKLLTYEEERNG